MKICTVWGDLDSDRTSENYSTALYCEKCFQAMRTTDDDEEESNILEHRHDDGSYGNACEKCDKTKEEEEKENR